MKKKTNKELEQLMPYVEVIEEKFKGKYIKENISKLQILYQILLNLKRNM
jgi:hypothetical protein